MCRAPDFTTQQAAPAEAVHHAALSVLDLATVLNLVANRIELDRSGLDGWRALRRVLAWVGAHERRQGWACARERARERRIRR